MMSAFTMMAATGLSSSAATNFSSNTKKVTFPRSGVAAAGSVVNRARCSSSSRRVAMMPPVQATADGSLLGTTYVARESMKRSLMDSLPEDGFLAGGASEEEREAIGDLIVQLEQLNPTEDPAREILDGTWEVVWTGGLSPALLAAQALLRVPSSEFKSLVLEIGSKSTLVVSTAMLSVGGQLDVRLTLRSRVGPESGVRLREQYELTGIAAPTLLSLDGTATAEEMWARVKGRQFLDNNLPQLGPFADEAVKFIGGAAQPLLGWAGEDGVKLPLSGLYERVLYVSFMDDDTIIARDVNGAPSVLVRKMEEYNFGVDENELKDLTALPAAGTLYLDSLELPAGATSAEDVEAMLEQLTKDDEDGTASTR